MQMAIFATVDFRKFTNLSKALLSIDRSIDRIAVIVDQNPAPLDSAGWLDQLWELDTNAPFVG